MFFEILLFLFLGTTFGLLMGLIPGIHPNMVILIVPALFALGIDPILLIVFIVSLGITNVFTDYIPSILLGAPDSESALSVLPGHKMLLEGRGYQAVKLSLIGGVLSVIFCFILLPIIILGIPELYHMIRPFIHFILLGIVSIMILTEKRLKKVLWCIVCFVLAGAIGILSFKLPVDNSLILFPIFAGFFGMPFLIMNIKEKSGKIPWQQTEEEHIDKKMMIKSAFLGTVGGVFSGLLPGVGSSEIAGLATTDKDEKSFLITMGAITTANLVLSFSMLWLIGNARSGLGVAIDQMMKITQLEFSIMMITVIASTGIAAILTLLIAKRMIKLVQKVDYSVISKIILITIICLVYYFTGFLGLLVTGICCSMGIFVNLMNVKRGILMGVLILPTILFFAGMNI
ncbi:MAG: tripartite tricarboxylate transporter permease [Candidatus Aenigmatarchaeota archaeon]